MIDATKLQLAADFLQAEMSKRGHFLSDADALGLARRLHGIWSDRHEINTLKPGDVAQRFRERYSHLAEHEGVKPK